MSHYVIRVDDPQPCGQPLTFIALDDASLDFVSSATLQLWHLTCQPDDAYSLATLITANELNVKFVFNVEIRLES